MHIIEFKAKDIYSILFVSTENDGNSAKMSIVSCMKLSDIKIHTLFFSQCFLHSQCIIIHLNIARSTNEKENCSNHRGTENETMLHKIKWNKYFFELMFGVLLEFVIFEYEWPNKGRKKTTLEVGSDKKKGIREASSNGCSCNAHILNTENCRAQKTINERFGRQALL